MPSLDNGRENREHVSSCAHCLKFIHNPPIEYFSLTLGYQDSIELAFQCPYCKELTYQACSLLWDNDYSALFRVICNKIIDVGWVNIEPIPKDTHIPIPS